MAGRGKKKQITDKELQQAEELALCNCKNRTIAKRLGWDKNLIEQRSDIKARLEQKRAQFICELHKAQRDAAIEQKNVIMQIFLGKNELGQADKPLEIRHGITEELAKFLAQIRPTKGVLPAEEKNGQG